MFPACAGVIRIYAVDADAALGVPRMCGGDPIRRSKRRLYMGVFPACAGVILYPRDYID